MKSFKLGAIQYRSRCAAALALAKRSQMSNKQIAARCGITPAAVSITVRNALEKDNGVFQRNVGV